MSAPELLHGALAQWARRQPTATAVECGDERLSYAQLSSAARQLARRMAQAGLRTGDRVGLLLPKSAQSVIAMYAVLSAGAAYVPLDEQSPAARQLGVLHDCGVRGLVATRATLERLLAAEPEFAHSLAFVFSSVPLELPCPCLPWQTDQGTDNGALPHINPAAPAYLLYTSGSTGKPKGVVVSHRGARSFVDWAIQTFHLTPNDHLANHAQLNFDLSILDVFASLSSGARVQLIPPRLLLRPHQVSELMHRRGITVSYSVPSTLVLLARDGRLGEIAPSRLTRVLFAGEVFPVPALRRVMQALPHARFFNLFGPTETNVCTWHALPAIPAADAQAIPIGQPCRHIRAAILDSDGQPVPDGAPGELCVAGPPVLLEYFERDDLTRAAFWELGPGRDREPMYRTGDRVRQDARGLLWFLGRRDRQVKRRGYRIELGEIESALALLPGVRECAVVATADTPGECHVRAVLVPEPGADVSVLTIKLHCGRLLPPYMLPDSFDVRESLPRTSTGKIDLLGLQ